VLDWFIQKQIHPRLPSVHIKENRRLPVLTLDEADFFRLLSL